MKKIIFIFLITLLVITFITNALADTTYGTVKDITKSTGDSLTSGKGTLETKGDTTTITYSSATFKMLPADNTTDEQRPGPAAWIGFEITEPTNGNSKFKVTTPDNETKDISASSYRDYVGITPNNLKNALLNGTSLTYKYSFDWDEDGNNDQYVIIKIDPYGITLLPVNGDDPVWSPEIAQNIIATEKNPNTSDINLLKILGIIVVCCIGLVYSFKKLSS